MGLGLASWSPALFLGYPDLSLLSAPLSCLVSATSSCCLVCYCMTLDPGICLSPFLCLSLSTSFPPVSSSVFLASLLLDPLLQFLCPGSLQLSYMATFSAFPTDIHSVIQGAWKPQHIPGLTFTVTFTVLSDIRCKIFFPLDSHGPGMMVFHPVSTGARGLCCAVKVGEQAARSQDTVPSSLRGPLYLPLH